MEYKKYTCICGKQFQNPQSFNAHKSHCRQHLINKYGENYYNLQYLSRQRDSSLHANSAKLNKIQKIRENELSKWIAEKHTCVCCGKVMTSKYGSGKFCSRKCANTRKMDLSTKLKISETLRQRELTPSEKAKIVENSKKSVCKLEKPIFDFPIAEPEAIKKKKGYFSRNLISYPEKFWGNILQWKNIKYAHDYIVDTPKGSNGVYRLDFLVNNIDIEIDGSQHNKADVKAKDKKRDEYLCTKGYIVYRINWINPLVDKNKPIVNKQIEDLLCFIDNNLV